ncbi:cullin-associated nedd8-dissociated protein 1-like [Limosa lapponica baueri]|uniref:Cullin-associated nedd8-dissociated protein 1-like n=1 Tax=Limosa lapponica baueri TaxID=1758121 RepID=A0A2I0TDT9_LIMLA|nr:cullin-associated nedd8-dissociated protein 1-like [Limosa lapponica baueri]
MTANVCKKITAQLTGAIGKQEDVSVQLEALDILSDMLSRLGGTLYSFHSSILNCLLPQLTSPRLAVRKRAIVALGHLVLTCSGSIFSELTEHLLTALKRNESTSTTRTYIQCVAGISRQAGHRVVFDLLTLGIFISHDRCPKEMDPHIPNVMGLCLKYITFDPNYNYDNEEEEEMMDTENGEDEEQESDDEYSDDDDISWKVRRSAAKCLEAVVSSRHDLLQDFYRTLSPVLISRFKEREENVKADIFSAYISLLKQTLPTQSWLHASDAPGKADVPLTMLRNQVPNIVKALHKQLKEKSIKSRQGCFSLLTELANVLPGCLADHIPVLVPGIVFSLADKSSSSNMRIDTLSFLHVLLCNHQPEVFHPHIKSLLPPVVTCIGDPFYKITSEALLVTQQLVKVIRPLDKSCAFDAKPYVKDLFPGTLKRLKAADIDQEALLLTKTATTGYSELMRQLTAPIYSSGSAGASVTLHKQAYYSVAKCVAALSSACPKEAAAIVTQFIQDVKSPKSSPAVKVLAFLSLAEMGRTTNLSAQRELKTVILEAFTSPSEEPQALRGGHLGSAFQALRVPGGGDAQCGGRMPGEADSGESFGAAAPAEETALVRLSPRPEHGGDCSQIHHRRPASACGCSPEGLRR